MKNVNKILLITLTNIGDAVLSLPVVLVLKEKYPSAKLDVLLGQPPAELFKKISYFRQVIVYNKKVSWLRKLNLILRLRREKYDLIIDLRHSLFPLFIGAKRHTPLLFRVPKKIKHIRDFYLWKLKISGVNFSTFSLHNLFAISPNEEKMVNNFLKTKGIYEQDKLIIFAPGAKDKIKRWRTENFAWLSDKLTEQGRIILVGSSEEKNVIDEIISFARKIPLRLDGKIDLKNLIVLLKRCSLFVGNDSAPMHISSLLENPTIGIFGPTDVEKFKPLGKKSRVIKKGASINLVKPQEVLEVAKELIKNG